MQISSVRRRRDSKGIRPSQTAARQPGFQSHAAVCRPGASGRSSPQCAEPSRVLAQLDVAPTFCPSQHLQRGNSSVSGVCNPPKAATGLHSLPTPPCVSLLAGTALSTPTILGSNCNQQIPQVAIHCLPLHSNPWHSLGALPFVQLVGPAPAISAFSYVKRMLGIGFCKQSSQGPREKGEISSSEISCATPMNTETAAAVKLT